jgi:hypothetical protein
MISKRIWFWALFGLLALSGGIATAQDNDRALLDVLVKKGILSEKEAKDVEAEVARKAAIPEQQDQGILDKLRLGSWVQELALYGDLRLRDYYTTMQAQQPPPPGDKTFDKNIQSNRFRFRLRLNLDALLADNFFVGVQLSTSDNRDAASQNATFTGGYDNYNIYLSRAFLGWRPTDGLTFVAGRQENPYYNSELFWGPDIAVNGLVERIDFDKVFHWTSAGGEPVGSSGKDGKSAPSPPAAARPFPLELSLIAGQYIFFDNNEDASFAQGKNDAFQFETQLLARLHLFDGKLTITEAPSIFVANSASLGPTRLGANGQPDPTSGTAPLAGTGALGSLNNAAPFPVSQRDELFLQLPGDISFRLANVPVSLYWDFIYNFDGNDRFNIVYGPLYSSVNFTRTGTAVYLPANRVNPSFRDNFGWLVGIKIGQNVRAGDIGLLANYRQIGIDAIDPNLNTDNFAQSFLNTQGFTLTLAYNLTDFLVFSFTGWFAWHLSPNLYGGYATGPNFPIANLRDDSVLAFDLTMRF